MVQKELFHFQGSTQKQLYNGVMSWDANDFGSIIRNQGYFRRGVIHNIVDETDFKWKVGEDEE